MGLIASQVLSFFSTLNTARPASSSVEVTMDESHFMTASIVAIVIAAAAAFTWYTKLGWTTFAFSGGDAASWVALSSSNTATLRFQRAIFTVTKSDGTSYTRNVSEVLNQMAAAYKDTPTSSKANSGTLTLDTELNPFSFVIPGVNDRITLPTATEKEASGLNDAGATLVGQYRELKWA